MKALRGKRKDSEQKSHDCTSSIPIGYYSYMGMATTINTGTLKKTCSCRRKSHTMERFYLDMEFPNGNYYLVDILEIALLKGVETYITAM